jgi:hypothetical protein
MIGCQHRSQEEEGEGRNGQKIELQWHYPRVKNALWDRRRCFGVDEKMEMQKHHNGDVKWIRAAERGTAPDSTNEHFPCQHPGKWPYSRQGSKLLLYCVSLSTSLLVHQAGPQEHQWLVLALKKE